MIEIKRAKTKPAIRKTRAELESLVGSLVVGQQYILTDYYTKYIQRNSYQPKISHESSYTANPADHYEEILLTAVSPTAFDKVAYSLKYEGNILEYDFDNNICLSYGFRDSGAHFIGEIRKENDQWYKLIQAYTDEYHSIEETDYWQPIPASDLSRPGFITRRIDKNGNIDVPYDYKNIVSATYKPSYANVNVFDIEVPCSRFSLYVPQLGDGIYYCRKDCTGIDLSEPEYFSQLYYPDYRGWEAGGYCFHGSAINLPQSIQLNPDFSSHEEYYLCSNGTPLQDNSTNYNSFSDISIAGNPSNVEYSTLVVNGGWFSDVKISGYADETTFNYGADGIKLGYAARVVLPYLSNLELTAASDFFGNNYAQNSKFEGGVYGWLILGAGGGIDGVDCFGRIFGSINGGSMYGGTYMSGFEQCHCYGDMDYNTHFGSFSGMDCGLHYKNNKSDSVNMNNKWRGGAEGNNFGYYCAGNDFEQPVKRITTGTDWRDHIGYGTEQLSDGIFGANVQACIFNDGYRRFNVPAYTNGITFSRYIENSYGFGIDIFGYYPDQVNIGRDIQDFGQANLAIGNTLKMLAEYTTSISRDGELGGNNAFQSGSGVKMYHHSRQQFGSVLIGKGTEIDMQNIERTDSYRLDFAGISSLVGLTDLTMPDDLVAGRFDYRYVRKMDKFIIWNETTNSLILETTVTGNIKPAMDGSGDSLVIDNTGCVLSIADTVPNSGFVDGDMIVFKCKSVPIMIFSDSDLSDFNLIPKAYLDFDNNWNFGDDTNKSQLEADGTYKAHGDATVIEDENFNASVTAIGANAPTLTNWDDSSIQVPQFAHTLTKELNLLKEYRHAGVAQGTISFHAHVMPTTADAGTIKFYLEYYIKRGTDTRVTNTITATVNTNSNAWDSIRLEFADLQSNLFGPGTQIGARLYRLSTDPGTYTHPVAISTWGYHMELDMLGSHTRSTK